MKSETITVLSTGEGRAAAIDQAASFATGRSLPRKGVLHIRLLTEEMLGMIQQLTGNVSANFWLESGEKGIELHLAAHRTVSDEMRKNLLSVSTSGKNAAAVGIMGKLRDIFDRAFGPCDSDTPTNSVTYYMQGMITQEGEAATDPMTAALNMVGTSWSMQKYKTTVAQEKPHDPGAQEEWDELEKSIIANIADEVTVAIRGSEVEMVVYKSIDS